MGGYPFFLGVSQGRWVFARPESALLVIGPPRSGKTTSVVVPNVLAAPGAVVSASTKLDVLEATLAVRSRRGRCWLFDPGGTIEEPEGVTRLRWSPIRGAATWDGAKSMARSMVRAARPAHGLSESEHWSSRAEFLLAPLLHAASLGGASMDTLLSWVNRRALAGPMAVLEDAGPATRLATAALYDIAATEDRERSGILSTTSDVLSSYLSESALEAANEPNFDPHAFVGSTDTVYLCASGRAQSLVGPVIVALVEELRAAAYQRAAAQRGPGGSPVSLILDEVANLAPLPDLPAIVSEGAGQGLLTLVCLQDLSQARARWGREAEGFASLFGAKLVFAGIGDLGTLEALSALCGDVDVPVRSSTVGGAWWRPGGLNRSVTFSTRRQRRMPVDAVSRGVPGKALYLEGGEAPSLVELTPWHSTPAWRRLVERPPALGSWPDAARHAGRRLGPPPRDPGRDAGRRRDQDYGIDLDGMP